MRKISGKTKKLAVVFSVLVIMVILVLLALFNQGIFVNYANELLLVCILVLIFPLAILDYQHQKWLMSIENEMPILVRGVSEVQETGLTITKSLEKVVQNKMLSGPLSNEVHKLSVQMAWGTSFEDALVNFKERIKSSIVNRFCALVLEASRAGGTIKEVFTATSDFMEEMNEIERETTSQMRPYIIVIYAAFGVFLVTAVILVQSFFAPLQGLPLLMNEISVGSVDIYSDFFYKNMLISAVTGGLMAGKLGERRVMGGLKHAIVMSIVGYFVFFVLIPPNWFVIV